MIPSNSISLIQATLADYPIIQNMARFYVYDMSRYCGFISDDWACPDNGLYECFDLKKAFEESNRKAFLVKVNNELAGFVLLRIENSGSRSIWQVDEFFILAKFQSKKIGTQVAHKIWNMYPGDWELTVIPENKKGLVFWRKAVTSATKGVYKEKIVIIDYDRHQPKRIKFQFESPSHSQYILRVATINDAADIVDLQVRGWKHSYQGIIDQAYLDKINSQQRLEWRLENMTKGNSWTFVIEHNGKIVGECDVWHSRNPHFGKGEIFAFYVDKEYHRKGVGTMLWNAATQKLCQENLVPYVVVTLAKNYPARRFYESMGSIVCGEIQNTIDGKLYDEVIYKYELLKIRLATIDDVSAMVALSYQKRREYEKAQPRFWKYAQGAEEAQSEWFKELLERDNYILLVAEANHEIAGFVIGHIMQAPKVYDPGGLTLMVDDFCVNDSNAWETIGKQLIVELKKLAKAKGVAQMLAVCGAHDELKIQFLKDLGLGITSQWYVGSII